ncbi:hypothetical protein DHEL01_v209355 [Diaporthe helianthi]|uniref:Uncharacterized protein n=1 Tax=Diaporthe helianthi TaxID=158607 RepID=A0A2P5HPR8_DIAHE|nr:hypothetical protein DHEL01_v209355 [Diaporthe helianthi]
MTSDNRHRYYFIDATCDTNARNATQDNRLFEFFVQNAQHWARRAVERLRDDDDRDFARVFNVIFKTRKNDRTLLPRSRRWQSRLGYQNDRDRETTYEHVVNMLSDFGNNWRRTDSREEASLRFFSDNRRRWLNVSPDPESQQDRRYDPVNHVWFMGNVTALDHGQAVGSDGIPGSEQILHEVMHCLPYYLDDIALPFADGTSETSSWEAVMNCKKGDAHRNAESIALLGLWAALADTIPQGRTSGGFTLDRAWDVIPGAWEDAKNDFDDDELDVEERGVVSPWTQKWTLHLPYAGIRINRALRGDVRGYLDLTGMRR